MEGTEENVGAKGKAGAGMMVRHYLIDMENTGGELPGVERLGEGDRVEVFWSDCSGKIPVSTVQKMLDSPATFSFVHAERGTPNALDFQLLVQLFCEWEENGEYVIVSRDKGYDCAIRMAKTLGRGNIRRAEHIAMLEHSSTLPAHNAMPEEAFPVLTDGQKEEIREQAELIKRRNAVAKLEKEMNAESKTAIVSATLPTAVPTVAKTPPKVQSARDHLNSALPIKQQLSDQEAEFALHAAKESKTLQAFYTKFLSKYGQKDGTQKYKAIKKEFAWLKKKAVE